MQLCRPPLRLGFLGRAWIRLKQMLATAGVETPRKHRGSFALITESRTVVS